MSYKGRLILAVTLIMLGMIILTIAALVAVAGALSA